MHDDDQNEAPTGSLGMFLALLTFLVGWSIVEIVTWLSR